MAKKIASWLTFLSLVCYAIAFYVPVVRVTADVTFDGEDKGERRHSYVALDVVTGREPRLNYSQSIFTAVWASPEEDVPGELTVTTEWAVAKAQSMYTGVRVLTIIAFGLPFLLWLYYFRHNRPALTIGNLAATILLVMMACSTFVLLYEPVLDFLFEPVSEIHLVFQDVMVQGGITWAGLSLLLGIGAAALQGRE